MRIGPCLLYPCCPLMQLFKGNFETSKIMSVALITYIQLSLFLQSLPDLETLPIPVGLPFPTVLISFGCNDTTQHHKAVGLEQIEMHSLTVLSAACPGSLPSF